MATAVHGFDEAGRGIELRLPDSPSELSVAGVSKGFDTPDGRVPALEGVELCVPKGQFVAIIGPSGCGKSTLLRIVGGLLEPDGGAVSVFGQTPATAAASKQIGFVPQSPALLPWRSVLENVRLPFQVNRKARRDDQRQATVPLDPVELLESVGLGAALNRKPGQLSLGMQQRVAIARALVFDPSILLMDEPFSALDELTRERQRHELLKLWQSNRKTVLFVTHSVTEAIALADVVFVMCAQPGRIRALVPVSLPRPRTEMVETTTEFHALERRIRQELRDSWPQTEIARPQP